MRKENAVVVKNNKVILNLIQDLQRLPLQLVNNLRGRSRIKYGMTSLYNNGGFTLIELLVVVLIIGILAAVAVPQYQKAIDRSRAIQVLAALKAIQAAEEVFFLQNGYYTPNMQDLDIEVANIDGWAFKLMRDNRAKVQADSRIDSLRGDLSMVIYFVHSGSELANKPYCWTDDNNARAERLCKAIGTPDPNAPNERWFLH